MIISKPKANTTGAMLLFILILAAIFIYLVSDTSTGNYFILQLAAALLTAGLAVMVSYKLVRNYKTLSLGNEKMEVKSLAGSKKYAFKEMTSWNEVIVDTRTVKHKQLSMYFEAVKISISNQEHTNYEKVSQYLAKKYGSLKTK